MRRGIQIVVRLLAILILLRPFDCFATGPRTQEAMKCCLKGQCAPSVTADACCKNTVPAACHLVDSKAPGHGAPEPVPARVFVSQVVPTWFFQNSVGLPRHPPPRDRPGARNLPLLV